MNYISQQDILKPIDGVRALDSIEFIIVLLPIIHIKEHYRTLVFITKQCINGIFLCK